MRTGHTGDTTAADAVLDPGAKVGTPPAIVCAVDFSPTSISALELACQEALRIGAAVHVVHAFDVLPVGQLEVSSAWGQLLELRTELEREMETLCARHRARGVVIEGKVVPGAPVIVVTDAVERTHASLLVVGTHGRTGLARSTLGSVAARLVRAATVSVLTVPSPRNDRPLELQPVRVVLAALQLSGDEHVVIAAARELAPDAELHAVHVVENAAWGSSSCRAAEVALASAASRAMPVGGNVSHAVRCGVPAATILQEAVRRRADRIVVGTHRRGVLGRLVLGSVAEQVVRQSPVPTLTVHAPGAPHGSDA